MKCMLVVNQLNDPFYIDYDAAFAHYIIKTSKEKGFLEENVETTELDANLVMQLFSPLVLSQWLLIDQTKEPTSAIHCPNGFCCVFKHVDDLLFMAINGNGTETEVFLNRKIKVFIKLMRFLFGPVSEESGLSHLVSKKAKWDFLRGITNHWSFLADTEQAFLVEAVDRLHVNQLISEKSVEILEKSIKCVQTARDLPTQHAMLIVNNKLLALYSNRSAHELHPKDILSMVVLAGTLFPQTETLEDLFSRQWGVGEVSGDRSRSTNFAENSDGGDDEYHSAPNTPGGVNRSRSSSIKSERAAASRTPSVKSDNVADCPPGDEITAPPVSVTGDKHRMPGVDSVSQQSLSDAETLQYSVSADQNTSLLDMYREKYPEEDVIKTDHNTPDKTIGNLRTDFAVEQNVEQNKNAVHVSSMEKSEAVENLHVDPLVKGTREQDFSNPKSSQYNDDRGQIVSKNYDGKDEKSTPDPELIYSFSVPNRVDSNIKKTNSDGCDPPVDTEADNDLRGNVEPNIDIINRVSRSSTLSSDQSQEQGRPSSSFTGTSRSSSAMSAPSKGYPELTAHSYSAYGTGVQALGDQTTGTLGTTRERSLKGPRRVQVSSRASPNRQPALLSSQTASVESSVRTEGSSIRTAESYTSTFDPIAYDPRQHNCHIYSPQTVFLKTPTCRYAPYRLTTAQVFPGVTLVLLSQAPRSIFADFLYQVMHNIQDVLYGRCSKLPPSRSLSVYDVINSQLTKLHNNLKKYKGKIRNLSHDIYRRWEKEDLKRKLLDFLERDKKTQIPTELEAPLLDLYKRLKELFSCLYLFPSPDNPQVTEALTQLRVRVNAELLDYREYLNVKAQRNITMTSYIDDFPGLIHFIFIDRHFHQITAPSLNISGNSDAKNLDATNYLKQKIWQMYEVMMGKLCQGYTTVMMREGDFYFSYFLWFEDYAGNALPVQEVFKPNKSFSYPGILSGSFYKKLLSSCFPQSIPGSVRCYEMFLLHLGSVHPQFVATQCKKLAAKMWEMAGEPYSSPSLF